MSSVPHTRGSIPPSQVFSRSLFDQTPNDFPQSSAEGSRAPIARKNRTPAVPRPREHSAGKPADAVAADQAIAALAARSDCSRQTVSAHQEVFAEGDPAGCYFLVVAGDLLIHRHIPGIPTAIRFAGPGDLLSYASGHVREAACHAISPASLVCLDRAALDALAGAEPAIARRLDALRMSEQSVIGAPTSPQRQHYSQPGAAQPDEVGRHP